MFALIVLCLMGVIAWFGFFASPEPVPATSFETCVAQAGVVMESYPRQCRDAVGNTFVEPIEETIPAFEYTHADADDIVVSLPFPGAVVGKEFRVLGEARGWWFFEASFPIELVAYDGTVLASGVATAESDWMTEEFVPFSVDLSVEDASFIGPATLVLLRDNPSGLPENDASISFPLIVEY